MNDNKSVLSKSKAGEKNWVVRYFKLGDHVNNTTDSVHSL